MGKTGSRYRLLLVDDHRLVREGLVILLGQVPDVEVVGQAEDGHQAIRLAGELHPDLVLMDVAMPGLNGTVATRELLTANPEAKVIAVSAHADRRFVAEMFRAGARGYLLKGAPFDELEHAIRKVLEGKRYISPEITDSLLGDYAQRLQQPVESALDVLSPREREVLQLIAEGRTTRDIARKLHVSVKTVETHRRSLLTKLNVRSVAELTKIAIREGLTSLDF